MRISLLLLWTVVLTSFAELSAAQDSQPKRVAILDVIDRDGLFNSGVKLMLRSSLSSAITNTSGYEGYDRVDMASIMNEHEFQRSGLVSDSQIRRLGEMAGAEFILVTEVVRFDEKQVVITAKILNVESARLERISDLTTTKDIDALEQGCRKLVERLLAVNLVTGAKKGMLKIGGNTYVGEYKDGKPNGSGTMKFAEDDPLRRKSYKGDWKDGKPDGIGTMWYYEDSNRERKYAGAWKNGKPHGRGEMTYSTGLYTGWFKNGKKEGTGTLIDLRGNKYVGGWVDDKQQGEGRIFYPAGDLEGRSYFEGQWENGRIIGTGKTVYQNGSEETVAYQDGKRNGKATCIYYGEVQKGLYVDDKKEGKWQTYSGKRRIAIQTYKNGELIKTRTFNK